ncbi:hypothetical protein PUR49_13940 [Streptomyces sp. BE147]|uniref:hypothetical protein n=1 Tax=Streptomyces sp. BE147 TaxID=3002524 RepID=UPI002E7982ED|nr:hypothetical protein [Streptomyces sp. BE147]MEE1737592.1 hypothetical protein [Streptomyces sp. BE147]
MIKPTPDVRHSFEPFTRHLTAGLLTSGQLRDLEREQPTAGIGRRVAEGVSRVDTDRVARLTMVLEYWLPGN